MRHPVLKFLSLIGFLAFSCTLPVLGGPRFINHPPPDLTVDTSVFEAEDPNTFLALGCDDVRPVSDLLGGLEPARPIARCLVLPLVSGDYEALDTIEKEGNYFYRSGGLFPEFTRYVILEGGAYRVLETMEDLKAAFGPVDGPEEALSFALAARDLSAYFGLELDPTLTYEVDELEDTHVVETADGYRINLYHYQLFGCGPHNTVLVDVLVTRDGDVDVIDRTPVFRDPSEDNLCVD